jgi:hypothetical protein
MYHVDRLNYLLIVIILTGFLAIGCSDEAVDDSVVDDSADHLGFALNQEDIELGKAIFDPARESDDKSDRADGLQGLKISVDRSTTAVWEVRNLWADVNTIEAREAGLAWSADSGLSWDEKYALWIKSSEKLDGHNYGETFTLTTPYGKTLPAPSIECAETSLFLRATFASWYHLPFFVEAQDSQRNRLYLGHFGFRTAEGRYANSAAFKTRYKDYEGQEDWTEDNWPQDSSLRKKGLGGSQDDEQAFLFEGARAGAYFDEIFTNKRVGHFMIYLLSYFGSINLADPSNTFNIKPEATREGDTLLHRWQRRGIGHTLVVKNVYSPLENFLEIELMSGSMPRRQPEWENAANSKYSLTAQKAGGLDENREGIVYARLGGGMKRWRTPLIVNGRWANSVPQADREIFVSTSNLQKIGKRIDTFKNVLTELTPEMKREVILERVIAARDHLSRYPASCAARLRREESFQELYILEAENFNVNAAEVDRKYRRLSDYVFAPLVYEESKTCCWNRSTAQMAEIIMQYAEEEVALQGDACVAPTVFKAYDRGYKIWQEYATSIGRATEWNAWSEDESCDQRDQSDDIIMSDWVASDYCEIQ